MKGGVFIVSSILSEDEKVHSSITDICSPDTTYLDLMIMYAAAKRKGKTKSFKLNYVNDMKWKGEMNMKENKNIKNENIDQTVFALTKAILESDKKEVCSLIKKNESLKSLFITDNKKSYTRPVILKSSKLLSEDKQKQYSDMY